MRLFLLTVLLALSMLAGCNDKGAGVSTGTSSSLEEGQASQLDRTKTLTTEKKTTATIAIPVMPLVGAVWGDLATAEPAVSQVACTPLWRDAARGQSVEHKPRALSCAFVMGYRFAFTPTMGWPMHPDEPGSVIYISAALAHVLNVNNLASEIAAELAATPRRDPEEAKADIRRLLEARRTQLLAVYPSMADLYRQQGVMDMSNKQPSVEFSRGGYHVSLSAGGAMVQYAGVDWFGNGNLSGKRYDINVETMTSTALTKSKTHTENSGQKTDTSVNTQVGVGK